MKARNRMADVIKLRSNACQDYLKMIITDGWQRSLYDRAKDKIEKDERHKEKYIPAFTTMRAKGVENYSIDDMDVSFISEIVHACKEFIPTQAKTRKAMEILTEDRNIKGHSNENEEDEELYFQGLIALQNLKKFVQTVDQVETAIPDAERCEYVRHYITKIDDLQKLLDEERISLVQRNMRINRDIQHILGSKDQQKAWCDLFGVYNKQGDMLKDDSLFYAFVVKASDAGIREAHGLAANYFMLMRHNYQEAEKRMMWLFNSSEHIPAGDAHTITDLITHYMFSGNNITEGMQKLVHGLISEGFPIELRENGVLWVKTKNKQ